MALRLFPSRSFERVHSRVPRAFAIVLLGFQALLWGGGSIAEAKSAAESLVRHSHVEDQGTTTCPPIHSHLDCLVCRTLNGGATGGSAPSLVPVSSGACEVPAADAVRSTDRGQSGILGSRAPPFAPERPSSA